jgi:uncharacterized protein (TIGR03437 family)
LSLDFNYKPNAAPYSPPFGPIVCTAIAVCPADPVFVGMTPTVFGLYQINFRVPGPPPEARPCGGPSRSNLTVSVLGASSFDGVGICIDTPQIVP